MGMRPLPFDVTQTALAAGPCRCAIIRPLPKRPRADDQHRHAERHAGILPYKDAGDFQRIVEGLAKGGLP
jgi:hypothetical protein